MDKYTLNIGLSTYIAMFYTHCYKLVAIIGFECVQIEPLVYNAIVYALLRINSEKL